MNTSSRRGAVTAALLAATVAAWAAGTGVWAKAPAPQKVPAGCDATRVATAHYAGQVVLNPQPSRAPIPCASTFGTTSQAAPVAVANDGTVFGAPLVHRQIAHIGAGFDPTSKIVRSFDRGAHWAALPRTPVGIMSWMDYRSSTGRLWYTTSYTHGQGIWWSHDDGKTWNGTRICCPKTEGAPKIIEGPAPAGGATPTGDYPNVVYFCANFSEEGLGNLNCWKSLDGGTTFLPIGGFPDELDQTGADCRNRTRPGVAGPGGVLYFPVVTCVDGVQGLGVRSSKDEGRTWTAPVPVVTTPQPDGLFTNNLAVDRHGTLYFAWNGVKGPLLSTSRDHGQTWSTPALVAAPGVKQTRQQLAITVAAPGHIAIAYLASTDVKPVTGTDTSRFNGYITESRNALGAKPVFWSAAVNNPAKPLELANSPTAPTDTARGFTNRVLYRTAAIGPDGTPWGGFHCFRGPSCPLDPGDTLDLTSDDRRGVIGHLEW